MSRRSYTSVKLLVRWIELGLTGSIEETRFELLCLTSGSDRPATGEKGAARFKRTRAKPKASILGIAVLGMTGNDVKMAFDLFHGEDAPLPEHHVRAAAKLLNIRLKLARALQRMHARGAEIKEILERLKAGEIEG